MIKSPQRIGSVLLASLLAVLVSGYFFREMILDIFPRSIEDERMAMARHVSSDFERRFERSGKWDMESAADEAVRALMLGLHVKVMDGRGGTVMDAERAVELLPPEKKALVRETVGSLRDASPNDYHSFPLVVNGNPVGSLDIKFRKTAWPDPLLWRFSILFLIWSFILFILASTSTMYFTRKTWGAIGPSVRTDEADGGANRTVCDREEHTKPLEIPVPGPMTEVLLSVGPEQRMVASGREQQPDEDTGEPIMEEDDEDMRPLEGDADRIATIVMGLDKLEKARALGLSQRKQFVELAGYLTGIMEKTRASVPEKDVAFKLECESDLTLSVDPECLSGIMTNLLDNAAKAVKRSGTVLVAAAAKNDCIVFTISDTGPGIRRKDLPHLFEQYYRASGSGIGLGLTIVKELVDACGGTIAVKSTRGKGAVFTVGLPCS